MLMEQLTLALCVLLIFIFDGVTPSPTPDASLLCISECGTCPLICSPPPAPVESKRPPSSTPVESKPPPSSTPVESKPPPSSTPYLTPIYHTAPPQPYSPPPPPPPTPSPHSQAKSCPPPSYIAMGTNAPPPPPPRLVVVPSTQIPPGDSIGQKNYSYPYYYFYASKGVSFSLQFSGFLILFISFHAVFLFVA